jgi:uncharacterized OsmC-like protein
MVDSHDIASAPQTKVVRAGARWEGRRYDNRIAVRDFAFQIAEPAKLGGSDAAPTPMEYVAGALSGCLSIVIEMVAAEQGLALSGIAVEAEGRVDQRGLFGTAPVSPHFEAVDVAVRLATTEPEVRLEPLKADVLRRCPVYNLLKDSGARVKIDWLVEGGRS